MANHPIVYLDIPAADTAAAARFYAAVFGWQIQRVEQAGYSIFRAESGPSGGFVTVGSGAEQGLRFTAGEVLIYINTADIDATLDRVEAHGGRRLGSKIE